MAWSGSIYVKAFTCGLVLFCVVTEASNLRPIGTRRVLGTDDPATAAPAEDTPAAPAGDATPAASSNGTTPEADDDSTAAKGSSDSNATAAANATTAAAAGPAAANAKSDAAAGPAAANATSPASNASTATPATSADGKKVFDITQFGAKADGKTDSTQGFMQAWVAACKNSKEPSKIVVPSGTFVTGPVVFQGPCTSPSPITVEVQGTVQASTDLTQYTADFWFSFERINGLVLTGEGTFHGQGESSWKFNDCKTNKNCQRLPSSIKFQSVNNSYVSGLHSVDSKYFHFHVTDSGNFTANKVTITAPDNSPNTDGIHLSDTNLVQILDSTIGTGDDCISIGQGVTNALIKGVTCGPGHGISVGSLGKFKSEADVNGITVLNCTLTGTDNGARIKTYAPSDPSNAKNITFQDIIMNAVRNPIIIDQKYSSRASTESSSVHITDIHFKNFKGTSASPNIYSFLCSSSVPCEAEVTDIQMTVSGATTTGKGAPPATCTNAKLTSGGTLNPPLPTCQ